MVLRLKRDLGRVRDVWTLLCGLWIVCIVFLLHHNPISASGVNEVTNTDHRPAPTPAPTPATTPTTSRSPSPTECKASVLHFARENRKQFWVKNSGALKTFTRLLPKICRLARMNDTAAQLYKDRIPVFIDVGAGAYDGRGGEAYPLDHFSDDTSDALMLWELFEGMAEVHGFEPQPETAENLRKRANGLGKANNISTAGLYIHAEGLADRPGELNMMKNTFKNTAFLERTTAVVGKNQSYGYKVPVVTIDDFVQRTLNANFTEGFTDWRWQFQPATRSSNVKLPWYIKVDVEGGEMAVLNGMKKLLASRTLEVFSLEYAGGWSPEFFNKAVNAGSYKGPTLFKLQRSLFELGYHTFLLAGNKTNAQVTLLPVYDTFWHAEYEICFHPHLYEQAWCWNDLLVLINDRSRPMRRAVLEVLKTEAGLTSFPGCE